MKRNNNDNKTEKDENDELMFKTAKKNEESRKCGVYRQKKAFSDE